MKKLLSLAFLVAAGLLLQAQVAGDAQDENLSYPVFVQSASPFVAESCTRRTTQPFGLADYIPDSQTQKFHTGVDLACQKGSKIVAPFTCRVIHAVNSSSSEGWGTNVICKIKMPAGNHICFRTAHMIYGSLKVRSGQVILAGQTIGLQGNTGNSTASHEHHQLMDCNEDYDYDIDDGYAEKSGKFDQLRLFYNPLRFFEEFRNQREVRVSLNMTRFESNGGFSGHSWVSTNPTYADPYSINWERNFINGWEQRFEKRYYAGNSNVYYIANYLVVNQNGFSVKFRPYLPRKGSWRLSYKIPNDSQLSGRVRVEVTFKGYNDAVDAPMRKHIEHITFTSQNRGKYHPIGNYFFNCLEGKNCSVEVFSDSVSSGQFVGFEEVKFEYVSDMYEPFYSYTGLKTGNDNFQVQLPSSTEIGFINLIHNNATKHINFDLAAWHYKKDGRKIQLPCFTSSQAGEDESCVFLQGEKGDYLHIEVRNWAGPNCSIGNLCAITLLAVNNYPILDFKNGFYPLQFGSQFADLGADDSWYSKWMFKASAVKLMSGYCNEDFHNKNCLLRPDREVQKAEFVKMLSAATGNLNPPACTVDLFTDVKKGDWHCPYVKLLMSKLPSGFIWSGEAPDRFFPSQNLTRELAAFIAFKLAGFAKNYDPVRDEFIFCDVNSSIYRDEIHSLQRNGIVSGFRPDISTSRCLYNFAPNQILNRAQAAKIAFKVFEFYYQKGL